jgi:hypothetical protein
MPETAVDEDHSLSARENDVRFSGQGFPVKPVPIAHLMK